MVKRLECFFLKSYNKCFTSGFFFSCWSNLIQSHLYVWSASRKELCSYIIFFIISINHLFYNLDSGEKKKLFWKKSGKNLESWILKSV